MSDIEKDYQHQESNLRQQESNFGTNCLLVFAFLCCTPGGALAKYYHSMVRSIYTY